MAQNDGETGELPLLTAGGRLREARLAAGLELDEIAARTRIAKRHLLALEEDRYSDLASRTYAIGFSRTYARTLDLDEESIVAAVRAELAQHEELYPRTQAIENFEPGDPARIPSVPIAWLAALGVLVLLALLFVFGRSFLDPAAILPDDSPPAPSATAAPKAAAGAAPAPLPTGAVRLTALENGIWVKISDATGAQVYQKEMVLNESFTVPASAQGPVLSTARPDVLQIAVGTRVLPRLREKPEVLRAIPLAPASLLAAPTPTPQPTPLPTPGLPAPGQ
jgi:cytoskeleton protein RodZ